jgi:hypothetical protein
MSAVTHRFLVNQSFLRLVKNGIKRPDGEDVVVLIFINFCLPESFIYRKLCLLKGVS